MGGEREEKKRGTSERKQGNKKKKGGGGDRKKKRGEQRRRQLLCKCTWHKWYKSPLFPQVRTIAAVLLRRVFLQMEHTDLSEQIDSAVLQSCHAQLLVAVQSEPSPPIRRKVCDAIAELARSSIGGFLTLILPSTHSTPSHSCLSSPLFPPALQMREMLTTGRKSSSFCSTAVTWRNLIFTRVPYILSGTCRQLFLLA